MEDFKSVKNELQNIIVGDEYKGETNLIKTTQTFLKSGSGPRKKIETKFSTRAEEERALIAYANSQHLWVREKDIGIYITEGAEQKVYFKQNEGYVIKSADAVFYITWLDYFNNLLLHNAMFQNIVYADGIFFISAGSHCAKTLKKGRMNNRVNNCFIFFN